jgi:AcrR family transcriptional regulator
VVAPDKPPARRSDASRNDARILAAARAIFTEMGSDAPVSVIAERAGIGMGTLYRRYPSKDDLMRELSLANMEETRLAAEAALDAPDAWAGLTRFLDTCVEAGVDGSPRLSGPFQVTEEILQASKRTREAVQRLVDRAQQDGVLRPDVNAHDLVLLLHTLRELRVAHRKREPALRNRFLGIVLDGLRAGNSSTLPAPAATWSDVERAWQTMADKDRGTAESP